MQTLEAAKSTAINNVAINNILFATDFSTYSNTALTYALAIAQQFGATVYGAHVLPSGDYLFTSPATWPNQAKQEAELRQEAVARLEDQLRAVPHKALTGVGEVWEELSRFIRENDIDLLVIGTHGRTGARKLLMGSIAEQVFRQVACPVLTVGPNVHDQNPKIGHVLLATDFSEEAKSAASYASCFAQKHQARLSLLHVLDKPHSGTVDLEASSTSLVHRLQQLLPPNVEAGPRPEYFVEYGPSGEEILKFSADHGVDLIVMGVRPAYVTMGSVTHLSHSVAQHVVAHAMCPVLTIRG